MMRNNYLHSALGLLGVILGIAGSWAGADAAPLVAAVGGAVFGQGITHLAYQRKAAS